MQLYQRTCDLGVEANGALLVGQEPYSCTARAGVRQYWGCPRKRRVHGRVRTLLKPSAARARIECSPAAATSGCYLP